MAQLAIKGHSSRGNEVIEILEMLGGKNSTKLVGSASSCGYYIDSNGNICYKNCSYFNNTIQFTLEEFLVRFPYKVGNKVITYAEGCLAQFTIQDIRWNEELNKIEYRICSSWLDAGLMWLYKEKKEETIEGKNNDNWAKWDLPDGYEFQDERGNVIKTDVIKLVKKRPQYPKTYEECCKVLNLTKYPPALVPNKVGFITQYEDFPYYYEIQKLAQLLVCRNAYWKIAGEQMGLGKPWEPDWLNVEQDKFVIYTHDNVIWLNHFVLGHNVLAFPITEMRDAFYKNFKDSIETCKELL